MSTNVTDGDPATGGCGLAVLAIGEVVELDPGTFRVMVRTHMSYCPGRIGPVSCPWCGTLTAIACAIHGELTRALDRDYAGPCTHPV